MISNETSNKAYTIVTRFLFITKFFSFVLIQKKQKIKPPYFYTKNHRTYFPIATPAARVSHSTWGSLPAARAEILTVIFQYKNIRATLAQFKKNKCSLKEKPLACSPLERGQGCVFSVINSLKLHNIRNVILKSIGASRG